MLEFVKTFHDAFRGATWLFFVVVITGFAGIGLLLAWIAHSSVEKRNADEQQSAALSRQLAVEWHMVFPAVIPAGGRFASLELFEVRPEFGGGGLMEISGTPGADFAGKTAAGFPRQVKEYRITNYSSKPMFNVDIALHLVFKQAMRRKDQPNAIEFGPTVVDRDWRILIPKVDPGESNSFVFYAMNNGRCFASVAFPDAATALIAGTNSRTTVQIITPGPDSSFFPPADVD